MRFIRRAILALCTLLTLATVALWIRSNRVSDIIVFDGRSGRHYELVTLSAQIRVTVVDNWPGRNAPAHFRHVPPVGYPIYGQTVVPVSYWRLGCGGIWGSDTISPIAIAPNHPAWAVGVRFWLISFPMALLIVLFGAYPAWDVFGARRRRVRREDRLRRGLCVYCGYDLRHSPGRCPECGRLAAAPAVATA